MKKLHLFSLSLLMTVLSLAFTSCGSDDEPSMPDDSAHKLTEWIEPYTTLGASVDQVKDYMTQKMPRYKLVEEQHMSFGGSHLIYATNADNGISIMYSFANNGLLCITCDEYAINKNLVLNVLNNRYIMKATAEETGGSYLYLSHSGDMIVKMDINANNRVNVVYTKKG